MILHPTISLNLFISSRIFLVEPLGFSIYKSVSSANRDNYTYAYKQILLVVFLWRFVIYTYVFLSLITVVICAENFLLSPIICYCSITKSCLIMQRCGWQHIGLPCLSLSMSLPRFVSTESMMPTNHSIP